MRSPRSRGLRFRPAGGWNASRHGCCTPITCRARATRAASSRASPPSRRACATSPSNSRRSASSADMDAAGLIGAARRDTERTLFRARNGIKYLAGMGRPDVGRTPKRVVWQREKAQLWRYESEQRTVRPPLVIVFSVLGRSYVLDLLPGNSFVETMLESGLDVFLLDFGVPDHVDSTNTVETYVDGYLPRAIQAAARAAGSEQVDVLGYCFGGLLSVLSLAANPELPVRKLAVMASPCDFASPEGLLQIFARGRLQLDDVLGEDGNVPPEAIYRMFRTLKPTSDISNYATLWDRLWHDEFVEVFQAMAGWVRDQVPFPGALAEQCIELLLRDNAVMSGTVPIGGREVRLRDITCPVLNVIAEHDHIVSPTSARPLLSLIGSQDVEELRIPAGHIGLAMSREAKRITIP